MVFFFAQAISVAMYVIGFSEVLAGVAAGWVQDLLFGGPILGLSALSKLLVGFVVVLSLLIPLVVGQSLEIVGHVRDGTMQAQASRVLPFARWAEMVSTITREQRSSGTW